MPAFKFESSPKSVSCVRLERKYSAHNYTPIPIVFETAKGAHITDVDGNKFLDFGASYSATNTGHNHPKIVEAVKKQYDLVALPSRAFTHNLFGEFCQYVCEKFNFEKVLPLNGGSEAIEFAIKLCRSWGYVKKGIKPGEAKVMMMSGNYHGRTMGVTSASTNESARKNYGPFLPGVGPWFGENNLQTLTYDDVDSLETCFKLEGAKIAGLIFETVQGERGIYVPSAGYLEKVRGLCDKYNILWCADEVQMGSYRCGNKFWAYENVGSVKPDIVVTAKSITGGLYPCSLVLSSSEILDTIEPNSHGATFSGSPIACVATLSALKVYDEENLGDRVPELSKIMINGLMDLKNKYDLIRDVRAIGLIAGIDIDTDLLAQNKMKVWHLCMYMRGKGIACKMVHDKTIRFCPPLVITKEEIMEALGSLESACKEITAINPSDIPDVDAFEFLCH